MGETYQPLIDDLIADRGQFKLTRNAQRAAFEELIVGAKNTLNLRLTGIYAAPGEGHWSSERGMDTMAAIIMI